MLSRNTNKSCESSNLQYKSLDFRQKQIFFLLMPGRRKGNMHTYYDPKRIWCGLKLRIKQITWSNTVDHIKYIKHSFPEGIYSICSCSTEIEHVYWYIEKKERG